MNDNKTGQIVGGIIAILVVGAIVVYAFQTKSPSVTNNYITPPATTETTGGTTTTPPASAQPSLPRAVTQSNVSATDTTAVVTGTVTPNGAFTSYWYEYGASTNLGSQTSNQAIGSGYAITPAPAYITGLSKDTTYYFRLAASNSFGKVVGATYSFTTTHGNPPPVGSAPMAKSLAASGISRTTANLNGYTNPNGVQTSYWFEYGKTQNLGNSTAFISAGSGTVAVTAAQSISNLDPLSTYYFRLNAQNQFGTVNGSIMTFKTTGPAAASAPTVTTRSATNVSNTDATLRGTVNSNGSDTTYWFEYSTDSLLGSVLLSSTGHTETGAGTSTNSVQTTITGLKPNTTYYYHIVAQNGLGTVNGSAVSFKTDR